LVPNLQTTSEAATASGVVAGGGWGKRKVFPKFWAVGKLSENLLLVKKFSSDNARFGAQNSPLCKKSQTRFKVPCRKFATLCRNSDGNLQRLSENGNFLPHLLL